MKKITDIDPEIKKKIIEDREKDYGDYQHNFTILAEMITLVLYDNLKNYHDMSIYNDMSFNLHKKDIDKKV